MQQMASDREVISFPVREDLHDAFKDMHIYSVAREDDEHLENASDNDLVTG